MYHQAGGGLEGGRQVSRLCAPCPLVDFASFCEVSEELELDVQRLQRIGSQGALPHGARVHQCHPHDRRASPVIFPHATQRHEVRMLLDDLDVILEPRPGIFEAFNQEEAHVGWLLKGQRTRTAPCRCLSWSPGS